MTISVLDSALKKTAKVTPLGGSRKLYRGLRGVCLPDQILDLESGEAGFCEISFISLTPDKQVALHYAGALECQLQACKAWCPQHDICGEHKSTMMEIGTDAINRGASLDWYTISPFSPARSLAACYCHYCGGLQAL